MLDSVIKTNHPQTLLEERKYEIKKKNKMENLINGDLDSSISHNETDSDSD